MDQTAWPTVVDDAVKIGLGAIIGAVATFVAAQQALRLQLRGEYAKRRRDALDKIASEFNRIALKALGRAASLTALPFGSSEDDFRRLRDFANLNRADLTIQDTYDLHALEAQLALLAYSYISEAMEEYRELATTIALAEPTTSDRKEFYDALLERTQKQRTWVVTMMAEAYQNAHRESFPPKLK